MPYEITTIGSFLGSCECGKDRKIDPVRIAGIFETLTTIGDRLNPFSDHFFPYDVARSAAAKVEEKAQAIAKATDPLPATLDIVGVPTWGYQAAPITIAALVGVVAVGGLVALRVVQKKNRAKGKKR